MAGGPVFFDGARERGGIHAELGIRGNLAQGPLAEAERDDAFLDRRVGLLGGVDAQQRQVRAPAHAVLAHAQIEALARGRDGVEGRDRGRVVDHPRERLGQADHLAQP